MAGPESEVVCAFRCRPDIDPSLLSVTVFLAIRLRTDFRFDTIERANVMLRRYVSHGRLLILVIVCLVTVVNMLAPPCSACEDIGKPEGHTHSISGMARQDGEISPCNGGCSCCCIPLPTILQSCIVLSVNQWRLRIAELSLVIGSIEIPHHPPRS
jgi:hypothetical protein